MRKRIAVNKFTKPMIRGKNKEAKKKYTQSKLKLMIKRIYNFDANGNVIKSPVTTPRPFHLERQTEWLAAEKKRHPDVYYGSYLPYKNWPINWKIGQKTFNTGKPRLVDMGRKVDADMFKTKKTSTQVSFIKKKLKQTNKSSSSNTRPVPDWITKMKRIKTKNRR